MFVTCDVRNIVAWQPGKPEAAEEVLERFLHVHLQEVGRDGRLQDVGERQRPEEHLVDQGVQRLGVVDLPLVGPPRLEHRVRVFEGEDGQEVVQVVDGGHVGEVDAGKELILEPVPAVGHDELELVQKLLLVDRVGLGKSLGQDSLRAI